VSVSRGPSSDTYRFELTDLLHLSLVLRQLSVFHLIQTLCRRIFSQFVEVLDSVCFLTVLCLPPAGYYLHADQVTAGFGAIRDAVRLHSNNWRTCIKPFVKYDNESLNKHFGVLKPSKSVNLRIQVFQDVMLCHWVSGSWHLKESPWSFVPWWKRHYFPSK
jgi:hypothetical protein